LLSIPGDERHQIKCDKYWPNRGKAETYGDVTVKCVSESAHERVPNLTTRTFKVSFSVFLRFATRMILHSTSSRRKTIR
jgi:hypothetical protein